MPNEKSVLVVDDEMFFRSVLKELLVKNGYTVAGEAADGDEAVVRYRECAPALVLMDIYMPKMNGIEAVREILAADPAAKILVCSGTGYDDDINAAVAFGAKGIIYKPFYEEEILAAIKEQIG
ncbi:MAG: response regulator [Geobacter sp.]|nr:response regulator [Geobacter sp.]